MITADNTGRVLSWPYRRDNFTGYGWFEPGQSCDLNLKASFSTLDTMNADTVFPEQSAPIGQNPLFDPQLLDRTRAATEAVANLPNLSPTSYLYHTSSTGALTIGFAPAELESSQSEVECTLLEYGAVGAGAGLLQRHAKQLCSTSTETRGSICPISGNHFSFSPARDELYTLVSSENAEGTTNIYIVGLSVKSMAWLPTRVHVGVATKSSPSLSIFSIGGQPAACVLNGRTVRVVLLRSGASICPQITSKSGPWDAMDFHGDNGTLVVSAGDQNVVSIYKTQANEEDSESAAAGNDHD